VIYFFLSHLSCSRGPSRGVAGVDKYRIVGGCWEKPWSKNRPYGRLVQGRQVIVFGFSIVLSTTFASIRPGAVLTSQFHSVCLQRGCLRDWLVYGLLATLLWAAQPECVFSSSDPSRSCLLSHFWPGCGRDVGGRTVSCNCLIGMFGLFTKKATRFHTLLVHLIVSWFNQSMRAKEVGGSRGVQTF